MFKKISKTVNERDYSLFLNGQVLDFTVRRLKSFKDEYSMLISGLPSLTESKGFFIYKQGNFSSLGLSEPLDLVWVDWDGKIIHIEEHFPRNKITDFIKNTKFIYIFQNGTLEKKSLILNDLLTHMYVR